MRYFTAMNLIVALIWLIPLRSVPAEEQGPPVAYLDPATVDADFAVQGEYIGEVQDDGKPLKVGAQIIALGEGKFSVVGYDGGLPGDGWNHAPPRRGEGMIANGVLSLNLQEIKVIVKDGVLTVKDENGNTLGSCQRQIRKSPTLGAKPPKDAIVLFDGTSVDQFPGARMTNEGLLTQGSTSKPKFQSGTLHLEFQLSYMPTKSGQQRANSGCYLQGRYEVQILDSFGLEGKHNECGGIYSVKAPDENLCFPPLSWQTYDITFTAAKYDAEGNKTADARLTVKHNGVLVHHDVPVPHATTAAPLPESPAAGPIYLQDHKNPIRFRNIWYVEAK